MQGYTLVHRSAKQIQQAGVNASQVQHQIGPHKTQMRVIDIRRPPRAESRTAVAVVNAEKGLAVPFSGLRRPRGHNPHHLETDIKFRQQRLFTGIGSVYVLLLDMAKAANLFW